MTDVFMQRREALAKLIRAQQTLIEAIQDSFAPILVLNMIEVCEWRLRETREAFATTLGMKGGKDVPLVATNDPSIRRDPGDDLPHHS